MRNNMVLDSSRRSALSRLACLSLQWGARSVGPCCSSSCRAWPGRRCLRRCRRRRRRLRGRDGWMLPLRRSPAHVRMPRHGKRAASRSSNNAPLARGVEPACNLNSITMMRITLTDNLATSTGQKRRPSTANANAKTGSGVASPPTRHHQHQGRSSSSSFDSVATTNTNTRKPSTSTSSSSSSRRLHMPWSAGGLSRKDRDKALHTPPQALAQTQINQPDSETTSNPPKSSHKHAASTTITPSTSESPSSSHPITTPAQPPSRPRLGARTLSAPLAHSSLDSPPGVNGHDFQAYLDYSRYLSGDDETPQDDIAKDPFFQRYHESPHYTSNDRQSPMDGPHANGPRSPPSQARTRHLPLAAPARPPPR
ncbi:uncharacterized protein J3D65DRAFT_7082 [Phyllosticta citribraziliensis]|uniref:Uncharacterized protein n=1 Tax=Phyllosticta citribraziliensis TaxID=989973 RepID=A0ABR1M8B2_9PEZI